MVSVPTKDSKLYNILWHVLDLTILNQSKSFNVTIAKVSFTLLSSVSKKHTVLTAGKRTSPTLLTTLHPKLPNKNTFTVKENIKSLTNGTHTTRYCWPRLMSNVNTNSITCNEWFYVNVLIIIFILIVLIQFLKHVLNIISISEKVLKCFHRRAEMNLKIGVTVTNYCICNCYSIQTYIIV